MNYKTILLSPHSDDIAYSIGGLLALGFFEKPIKIITIFGETNISPYIKLESTEKVSKIRNLEDSAFADSVGAEIQYLHFSDFVLRKYKDPHLYKDYRFNSDPLFIEIYDLISNIRSIYSDALLVSPMGIMYHPDHNIVAEVCAKLIRENKKIAFYEDIPYSSKWTLKKIKERANLLNPNLQPNKIDITTVFENKKENLKLYKSQLCENEINPRIKLHAARLGFRNENLMECIWKFSPIKYLFKKYCIRSLSLPLYERIWI
jgi:LmbE family N-acetylglucosaminyl deacetylase